MKFARIGKVGQEVPVVLTSENTYVSIADYTTDIDSSFLSRVDYQEMDRLVEEKRAAGLELQFNGQRFGAPISRPHQIICIGLNYADHAAESGQPIPSEPIVFNKAPNTLVGPNDDVMIPKGSTKTDWEVELGIVIGSQARYLDSQEDAWKHIAGFVLVNDVSERAFQMERGGQWVKGKSSETFNPCGPWLATPDEFADVQSLEMWLDVNGKRMQTGNTSTMIFDVPYIVWYLSQFMVLEPGDLINTGTPPGVGLGMNPPTYLAEGDTMDLGISGLGKQQQQLILATP